MQKAGTLAIARVPAVFVFSTVKDGKERGLSTGIRRGGGMASVSHSYNF
jgi:hypothetical protein